MRIAFQVDTRKAEAFFSRLTTKIKESSEEVPKEVAGMAAGEYIRSAEMAGIYPWRGTFYGTLEKQRINPRKLGKNTYGVSIAPIKRGEVNYFLALDNMRPHSVPLFPQNRIIAQWAYDKLNLTGMPSKKAFITVHPHPFIDRADINIIKRVNPLARKIIKQKIRQSKK